MNENNDCPDRSEDEVTVHTNKLVCLWGPDGGYIRVFVSESVLTDEEVMVYIHSKWGDKVTSIYDNLHHVTIIPKKEVCDE